VSTCFSITGRKAETGVDPRQDKLIYIVAHRLLTYPKNESKEVFAKLSSGRKFAYIGLNTEINEIMTELKTEFRTIKFFRRKENLWSHIKNWQFLKYSYSQPKIELVRLMSSGIYRFWKYWIRDRKYIEFKLREEQSSTPKTLSISSNLGFVFVPLSFGLITSSMVHLLERVHYACMYNILTTGISCWQKYSRTILKTISMLILRLALFQRECKRHDRVTL